ncbi:MAG: outer membrane lipoprotein carrier protein LolA [Thermoanaerobaculia bacterium]
MKRAPILLLSVLALAGRGFAQTAPAGQEVDPWVSLKTVRQSLVEAGPTGASFVQTYIPAGFTSGEKENGKLALALPDCLRWDYTAPYPKSFLICGGVLYAWNEEDKTGRRYRVDRKKEPGLDLLLLGVDELKDRYRATGKAVEGGRVEIALTPKDSKDKAKTSALTDATLTVDPATKRVTGIAYHDREGNLTRFEIAGYEDLPRQGRFTPPNGIKWEEQ